MSAERPAKYLRFVRSIALGAFLVTGCGSGGDEVDSGAVADAGMDGAAPPIDAAIDAPLDAPVAVDGPLHPPNLRRLRA